MCGSVLSPPMEHILSLPGGCVLPVPRTQVGESLSKGCGLPAPARPGGRARVAQAQVGRQAGRPGSLSKEHSLEAQDPRGNRLALEIDGELSAQLSLKARTRGQTVGGL